MTRAPRSGSSGPVAGPLEAVSIPAIASTDAGSAQTGDMTHPRPLGRRLGRRQLFELSEQLSDRDHEILQLVSRFRLVQGDQIQRLLFHDLSTEQGRSRVCRRVLQRLTQEQLLVRTERQVGGARAGSRAHTYLLTPAGRRVVNHYLGIAGPVSDRGVHGPGPAFHAHTLAITEFYTRTVEADRAGALELLAFDPEPSSWRHYSGGIVKPDAYVVVAAGDYEYTTFVEVDLATEGRVALARKLKIYSRYHQSGRGHRHGVFPRILWTTPTPARAATIETLIETLPRSARKIFATSILDNATTALTDDTPGAEP